LLILIKVSKEKSHHKNPKDGFGGEEHGLGSRASCTVWPCLSNTLCPYQSSSAVFILFICLEKLM